MQGFLRRRPRSSAGTTNSSIPFPQRVDTVFERQKRRNRLERTRKHLYREGAARACDLHNKYNNRKRLSDYAEGNCQRIDYQRINKARNQAGDDKHDRIFCLRFQKEQIAERDNQSLNLTNNKEYQISAEEKLHRICFTQLFTVMFREVNVENRYENNAADPQRERRTRRTMFFLLNPQRILITSSSMSSTARKRL